jgi:EAL domain-containing protein (putative c-di-GMP-specific phosphodiesterase class I)
MKMLEKENIATSRLTLEVTESALMNEDAVAELRKIRNLGFKIAIDDFGTGFSSLAYLRRLPLDVLKIDKCFVSEIGVNSKGMQILKSIVELAHALDLSVIAEGVETEQQRDFLKQLSCSAAQGYLFGKAIPAKNVQEFIMNARRIRGAWL